MRVLKSKKLSTTKTGSTGSGDSPAARRAVSVGKVQASKAKRATSTKGSSASSVKRARFTSSYVLLDPSTVATSQWQNRSRHALLSPDFLSLKTDILKRGGNTVPVLVRPIDVATKNRLASSAAWELAYGHRRLRACAELGLKVRALVESMTDLELIARMHTENSFRTDISPYEKGVQYARMRDARLFASDRQLAAHLGIDVSEVSRTVFLARLPHEVLSTIDAPLSISMDAIKKLQPAWNADSTTVLQRAREINETDGPLPPAVAIGRLVAKRAPSVGASNTQKTVTPLSIKGRRVGEIVASAAGNVTVVLDKPLNSETASSLEAAMLRFARKHANVL
jgi:ParB family transcriptional regulator, chromosome partitioning protein